MISATLVDLYTYEVVVDGTEGTSSETLDEIEQSRTRLRTVQEELKKTRTQQ